MSKKENVMQEDLQQENQQQGQQTAQVEPTTSQSIANLKQPEMPVKLPKVGQSLKHVSLDLGIVNNIRIPISVTVKEDKYLNEQIHDLSYYVTCMLDVSFLNDPFFTKEIKLVTKWGRDKSRFTYYARKRLAEEPEFIITGECFAYRYYNKKRKKVITYCQLSFKNPFFDSPFPIEFMIKDEGDSALFADLVSPLLKETIEVDQLDDEITEKALS